MNPMCSLCEANYAERFGDAPLCTPCAEGLDVTNDELVGASIGDYAMAPFEVARQLVTLPFQLAGKPVELGVYEGQKVVNQAKEIASRTAQAIEQPIADVTSTFKFLLVTGGVITLGVIAYKLFKPQPKTIVIKTRDREERSKPALAEVIAESVRPKAMVPT
jgi:hypothetical protein